MRAWTAAIALLVGSALAGCEACSTTEGTTHCWDMPDVQACAECCAEYAAEVDRFTTRCRCTESAAE